MKTFLVITLSFFITASTTVLAKDGASLLLTGNENEIDLSSAFTKQTFLDLDDPFKVQLFGQWKAARITNVLVDKWINLVLNNKYSEALVNYPLISKIAPKDFKFVMKSTLSYLQWKIGHNHAFLNTWLELGVNENLLQTQIGIALEQVVGTNATKWILENGFIFSESQKVKLSVLENEESKLNYSLQAWKAQRSGVVSLKWVNKLADNDELRMKLIYSTILSYANDRKLSASAQIIKKAVEPAIAKSKDSEDIALYYLTLARLLYQAKAFEASTEYYYLIPDSSKYFFSARNEVIWSLMQQGNISKAKGELSTLALEVFDDRFYPEVHLVDAIVHLKTCQFELVEKSLNRFIDVNTKWAKVIERNIKSKTPTLIDNDLFLAATTKHVDSITQEISSINSIFVDEIINKNTDLASFKKNLIIGLNTSKTMANEAYTTELRRKWQNRKKILENAIYRMRFVKVEFVSQMRNLALNIPITNTDSVSTYNAATARGNEISFPDDGVMFGDDLFQMSVRVKNLCLTHRKQESKE